MAVKDKDIKAIQEKQKPLRPTRNFYKENSSDINFPDYCNYFNKYRNSNSPDTDL